MAHIERAVEEFYLRIVRRRGQRVGQKPRRRGEHHVHALLLELAHGRVKVRLEHVEAAAGHKLLAQRLLRREPSLLMGVGPVGALRVLVVEESHPELFGGGMDNAADDAARLRLGGVGYQDGGALVLDALELRFDGLEIRLHFRRGAGGECRHTENLQIAHQRLVLGQGACQRRHRKCLAKAHDVGEKAAAAILVPGRQVLPAQKLQHGGIGPEAAEAYVIDVRYLIEIQKLVIDRDLRLVAARGQETPDLGTDGGRAEKAQDGDALVPLHHIEAVEIFHRDDGVAYPLLHMRGGEARPLCGKLAPLLQQRIEGRGKGFAPCRGAGADDLVHVDARGAEIDLVQGAGVGQQLLQRREIRVLVLCRARLHLFDPQPAGLRIGTV